MSITADAIQEKAGRRDIASRIEATRAAQFTWGDQGSMGGLSKECLSHPDHARTEERSRRHMPTDRDWRCKCKT